MTISRLVLCVLLGVTSINGKPPNKIVGGTNAYDGEFPYQVALTERSHLFCGGSILDSRHILTAAHCIAEKSQNSIKNIVVIAGSNAIRAGHANSYRVKSFKVHPGYAPSQRWRNDIAILTLATEIPFGSRQQPVKLPTKNTPAGLRCTASGWGDTYFPNGATPIYLKKLEMNVVSNRQCSSQVMELIPDSKICAIDAYGSGLCTGDSGGPLVSDGVIVGVASYVYPCGVGFPDVFTRVWDYIDWIKQVMREP